ncbi:hypothetical protein BHM03_00015882 [Ensete ventricosum]|nr:hypothetical protein BHM03_00015882 [Ensete ventricosum]
MQVFIIVATFDRSGRYVITGSDDRLVKIWSMETAFCLASCRGHEFISSSISVLFMLKFQLDLCVISLNVDSFTLSMQWRLPDGHPISVLKGHAGAVTAIAFSPRPSAVYQLLS